MTENTGLTALQRAVYQACLVTTGRAQREIEVLITGNYVAHDVEQAVKALIDLGLIQREVDDRLVAVNPALAEASVLGAEELEINTRRTQLELRRSTIRAAIGIWDHALQHKVVPSDVDVIEDPEAIQNILMYHAERCEDEILSISPGRGPTRVDARTRLANIYSATRGAKTRALYTHAAARDRGGMAYIREIAGYGASVRLAAQLPGRSLVIDRSVALLPIPYADRSGYGMAIVREPNIISWVVATFEQLWGEATPLSELVDGNPRQMHLDKTRAAIIRLLGEGEKDEAISRRLSISVRTCRRHIADYMAEINATSRFQAGVIAARSGQLDSFGVGEPGASNGSYR